MAKSIEVAGKWIPATCSAHDLVLIFGISRRAVADLVASGVVVSAAQRGRYQTIPSIHGYMEKLRKSAAGRGDGETAAEQNAKLRSIDIEMAQAKLDKIRGDSLSLNEVADAWSALAKAIKSAVLALPNKARSTIPHLTAHDGETLKLLCRDTLDLIADEIEAGVVGIEDKGGLGKK